MVSTVQKSDSLQAELNNLLSARTAAEERAAELASQLDQANRQLSILVSRDGELQTLAAELAAATSAKAALEAKVRLLARQVSHAICRTAHGCSDDMQVRSSCSVLL